MRALAAVLFSVALAASAAQVEISIRLSPLDAGQTIPVQGNHWVNASESYTLSVIANSGYVFKGWSYSIGATVANATAASTTFSATADAEIVANFESNIDSVYLNISTYPGSASNACVPAAGKHKYHVGDQIIINALPAANYQFARWQAFGKAEIQDKWAAETNLVVGGEGRAVAFFMPTVVTTNYTVLGFPFNVGTISPAGPNTATVGAPVTVAATATPGFKFVRWEVDGFGGLASAKSGSTTATFNGQSSLTAYFAPDPNLVFKTTTVSFAVSPPDCGASCDPAAGTYNYFIGDSLYINTSIDPDSGYGFLRWDLEGQGLLSRRYYADANVVFYNDCALTAVYAPSDQIATLTLASGGNGAVRPAEAVSVQTDTDFHIRAIPQGGYFFAYWSTDEADSNNVSFANPQAADTTVRLSASATLTANFVAQTLWLDRSLPYVTINLSTLKEHADNILVDRAMLLNQKADFDAAGSAVVVIDGKSFPFDIATAVPTDVGYSLSTRDPAATLNLSFANNAWSFNATKASLSDAISPTNGVDIYLSAGPPELGLIDGASYFMEIKGVWNYNSNTGVQTDLDVPGPHFADFSVLKAKKSFPKFDPTLNWLAVQKGVATLPTGAVFYNASDFLYFRLDNLLLYFYSNTLTQSRPDKYTFTNDASRLDFKIDFRQDIFSFKLANQIIPWVITPGDGVDVYLGVPGKANGGVNLDLRGKTKLKYTPPATSN